MRAAGVDLECYEWGDATSTPGRCYEWGDATGRCYEWGVLESGVGLGELYGLWPGRPAPQVALHQLRAVRDVTAQVRLSTSPVFNALGAGTSFTQIRHTCVGLRYLGASHCTIDGATWYFTETSALAALRVELAVHTARGHSRRVLGSHERRSVSRRPKSKI